MKRGSVIFLLLIIICFCGCKSTKYDYAKALIYKTEWYVFSRGHYKLRLYYEFEYNGDSIRNTYNYGKNSSPIPPHRINAGDSLIVKFPIGEPQKSKVIKLRSKYKRGEIMIPDTIYGPDSTVVGFSYLKYSND